MRFPEPELSSISDRAFWSKLTTWIETSRILRREKKNNNSVQLSPVSEQSTLKENEIGLVVTTHNEIKILDSFLNHYRRLGVSRFIFVDDQSTDGTVDFLLKQTDVDLWNSPIRFQEARRGRQWREKLFEFYGRNRWYVNVDTDEFLVFSDSEYRTIPELIKVLCSTGDKRLAAPMIDMYNTQETRQHRPGDDPWYYADHFDGCGYDMSYQKRGISIKGGPRGRRFGEQNELMKYPLIYWDDQCFFGSSIHRPLPYVRNFPQTWGALLHFKFFVNYREKISEAVREKQHFGGSVHYVKLLEEIENSGSIDLYDKNVSVKFTGSKQLADLGFITPIDWEKID